MTDTPFGIATKVLQQAIIILATWSSTNLTHKAVKDANYAAIEAAKSLVGGWSDEPTPKPLKLVFDQVRLVEGKSSPHYWKIHAIADTNPTVPHPVATEAEALQSLDQWKRDVQQCLNQITSEQDWNNLSLLNLILEKCGSYVSYGRSDISLFDWVKTTAAVATSNPTAKQLCLIAGDLSGIQNFIYTISSDGALKSLRARSFYVALAAEEIVQQLLAKLELPRTNIIYSGGGNFYLLAPACDETHRAVDDVWKQANSWLKDTFQAKIFLSLDCQDFPTKDVGTPEFANHWKLVIKQLEKQKNRKFEHQLSDLLSPQDAYEPCKVCHRDDEVDLKPLDGQDGVNACSTCRRMFRLGKQLPRVSKILRAKTVLSEKHLYTEIGKKRIYYNLFTSAEYSESRLGNTSLNKEDVTVLIVNDWNIQNYKQLGSNLLILGNYYKESSQEDAEEQKTSNNRIFRGFVRAEELAEKSKGIKRIGYLRMDVDRLGQIFAEGFKNDYNLPRLTALSRQTSYFFTAYLTSLAEVFQPNLHSSVESIQQMEEQNISDDQRPNLLFIYSGGDDLFISGAWNETVEFAFEVYQNFRAYTGNHPDITLSGGISLEVPKYPLYQAAADAGRAEDAAKDNGRDSLSMFGETFKWGVWVGASNTAISDLVKQGMISQEIQKYIDQDIKLQDIRLDLFGVRPFVQKLNEQLDTTYSRNFVQNLLATAQLQERLLKDIKEKDQARDVRYYLHLPKVAYTLARAKATTEVSKSLKSPYNAPYFRAIATWIALLNRTSSPS